MNRINCEFCNREMGKSAYNRHLKFSCLGEFLKEYFCQFCDIKLKSISGLNRHEHSCNLNPNKKLDSLIRRGANQYTKAKELGLPKPKMPKNVREKLILANRNRVWSQEQRNKHSIAMKKAVEKYPESYNSSNRGRCKQIIYDGISFHSNWEVIYYIYCKENNIAIIRNSESFDYIWNGSRKYFPDFYLPTDDIYIEVKGYKTERDEAKWQQFPKSLRIISAKEINNFKKNIKHFDIENILYKKDKMLKERLKKKEERLKIKQNNVNTIKENLLNSNITFDKFGWVNQACKIIGCGNSHVSFWMKKNMQEFYNERCFRRKYVN